MPADAALLYALEVAHEGERNILFVDLQAVCEALSEEARGRRDGLKALRQSRCARDPKRWQMLREEERRATAEAARTHPETDRRPLFVFPGITSGPGAIAGMEEVESVHSNTAVLGTTRKENGVLPTEHAWHETIEITHGWTPWFETGFYIFTSIQPDTGWEWVGDHIRPRVLIPEEWKWPVGLSLSVEAGYQRREFSTDTWT